MERYSREVLRTLSNIWCTGSRYEKFNQNSAYNSSNTKQKLDVDDSFESMSPALLVLSKICN